MADVTIKYKDTAIATLDGTGSKTLETSGTYCEGNIKVEYAPRSRTYEITLARKSGWVLLTTLDNDVLEHINDANLNVCLMATGTVTIEAYTINVIAVSNSALGTQGNYPVYGATLRLSSATAVQGQQTYYPANKTDTSTSLGGGGCFRINGNSYYCRPSDLYIGAGTYRLTFTW